jgi:hypothetical protein
MDWKKLLGSIPASVDEEIRLRNAYLVAENRILRQQIPGRVPLTEGDRRTLAALGQQLGRPALVEIATVAKADTILAWHRTFVHQTVDTSAPHKMVGRPRVDQEIESLVVRMARENRSWGYDRIVGALTNLGYRISDQTVGNILKRHGIPPAPERKKTVTWQEFIRMHLAVLGATDFFNSALRSGFGLLISLLLCFRHFGRLHVNAVGRILHHRQHAMRSFVLCTLNCRAHIQRWLYWITTCTQSGAIRCDRGLQYITLSPFTPSAEWSLRPHARGTVVCVSAPRSKQIRDGPMPRRPRLDIVWQDELRGAA